MDTLEAMGPNLWVLGIGAVIFLLVALIVRASVRFAKLTRQRWSDFAARHGLQYNDPGWAGTPKVQGTYEGVFVTVTTVSRGSGKSRQTYTQYQAMLRGALPAGLRVHRESFGAKVGKFFGGQDIVVGDTEVDEALVIRGNDEAAVRLLMLQPQVRAALLHLVRVEPDFVLDAGRVMIEVLGFEYEVEKLALRTGHAVALARAVLEALGNPAAAAAPSPRTAPAGPVAVLAKLADRNLMSRERDELLAQVLDEPVTLSVVVERADATHGFDVPATLRNGRTLIGTIAGLPTKVAVRLPPGRNTEAAAVAKGETVTLQGTVAGWQSMFDRVEVDGS